MWGVETTTYYYWIPRTTRSAPGERTQIYNNISTAGSHVALDLKYDATTVNTIVDVFSCCHSITKENPESKKIESYKAANIPLLNLHFGFGFCFGVCALWEKKKPALSQF